MTTLIIHPKFVIQQQYALELASQILKTEISKEYLPPDLHLIDGTLASSIGIDEVREFIKSLRFQPYESEFQVGLILQSNMLTIEAQNSLLKTLEEPGPQTRFILTTPHEKFLLPTIISRANKVYIRKELNSSVEASEKKNDEGTETINSKTIESAESKVSKFLQLDIPEKFLIIEKLLEKDKETPGKVQDFMIVLTAEYRKLLTNNLKIGDIEAYKAAAADIKKIDRARHYLSRNTNKKLTLENLILQLDRTNLQK